MKKGLLTILALGISASALAGCSAPAPAPAPAATQPAAQETIKSSPEATDESLETSSPVESSEAQAPDTGSEYGSGKYVGFMSDGEFTDLVRESTTTTYILSNYDIVEIAEGTCEAYDTGGNLRSVLINMADKFFDTTANVEIDQKAYLGDLAFITGAGVTNYCDEHGDQFTADIDAAIAEAEARKSAS